ncbi:MAG: glycerol-3-phosphate 1-O-acyltransferase PlsY [Clostridia bacterium]|nr:glycerol-3-phosphate 1-O-acyltransferase PlsY [Clostridia bacterium]
MIPKIIASGLLGYLIGSVVTAIIISRLVFREDVRTQGSGNSGATNAARVYGLRFGVLTFLGDFLKGVAACVLGRLIAGDAGLAAAGICCMAGHCFPVWFDFRGGKGVSVGAALALMIDWRIFVCAIAVFAIVVFAVKIVSVASLSATVTVGVMSLILGPVPILKALGAAAALLVIFMHRTNIRRLILGTEKKIVFGRRGRK